ncbi:1308_t:CDS:2 [Ambispora gerdemannii]|uniref:1308_t:CDS:1 n=1 Tax=Ambispora gerdemannii TaxID=144530 RepID=A0A9N9BKA0_9GLOM|nr:1308_t:CDS:2 [Ambispora gerdemannii]
MTYQTHPQAIYTSQLRIKTIEEELEAIKELLGSELAKLVGEFIQARQKMLKDEEDDQAVEKVGELEEKLKENSFSEEETEKITNHCEELVDLKEQLEKQVLQNQNKEVTEIELKYKTKFQGQLVIENYLELEKLCLQDVRSVDKVVLKNLTKLQECTIRGCNVKELIIENCSRAKKLNVRKNSLTNLEFLKGLDDLKELDLYGNTGIDNGLEYLPNNLQEITQYNPCQLAKIIRDLKKKHEDLKKSVSDFIKDKEEIFYSSKELITTELLSDLEKEFKNKEEKINYLEFRKQGLGSTNYRKQLKTYEKHYKEIEDELENKLDEEAMNEVQRILTNSELQGELKVYRSITPTPESQNETLVSQLIGELKERKTLASDEQEIITKAKELLGAKRIFLNTRQITIKGLQNCYNKLKGNKKYAKVDEVGNVINAGGTVAESLTFGVPKAFGETIKAINASFERKFSDKRAEEFQELLIKAEKLKCLAISIKSLRLITEFEKNLEELKTELDREEKQFKELLNG